MTPDILKLARAIAEHEGWGAGGVQAAENKAPTVAYRNHNPGNLRSSPFQLGKRDGFSYFVDDNVGFFALCWDIMQKARGNTVTGLTKDSNIEALIYKFAPPGENNVEAYIKHVEQITGWSRYKTLEELL